VKDNLSAGLTQSTVIFEPWPGARAGLIQNLYRFRVPPEAGRQARNDNENGMLLR